MRHTLLPLNERKALRREYRIRFFIAFMFMLSLSMLVGIGSLFPAYIRAVNEESAQLAIAANLQKNQKVQSIKNIEDELRNDQKVVQTLSKDVSVRISAVAQGIINLRQMVKLNSFSFLQNSTSTVTVFIEGNAPTRNDLLSFKERLEKTLPGSKVDLPISELAKSTDVQFSMKVTHKLR